MAGDWIKMRGNLWDDPRVARLVDMTDSSEAAVVGGLYWLWATADQHTQDGLMPGLSLRQIDRKTGIQGLGKALCDIGWLSETEAGVRLENFEEHNGQSAKRRCVDAQRKATVRTVSASDADKAQTNAGQETPDLGAREEKRREEDKKESAGEPATPPVPEKQKPRAVTLAAYLDTCKALATKAIPDDHHIRRYCADAGITDEMTAIAWLRFREEHTTGARKAKRYIDWPETFANCVKSSWYGLWVCNTEGPASWTSKGLQEKRVADARRAEKEAANAPA